MIKIAYLPKISMLLIFGSEIQSNLYQAVVREWLSDCLMEVTIQ